MNYYQEISGVTIVLPPQRLILVIYIVERSDRKPTPTDMQTQIYSGTHAHMQVSYFVETSFEPEIEQIICIIHSRHTNLAELHSLHQSCSPMRQQLSSLEQNLGLWIRQRGILDTLI